jgi:hypothetical protein
MKATYCVFLNHPDPDKVADAIEHLSEIIDPLENPTCGSVQMNIDTKFKDIKVYYKNQQKIADNPAIHLVQCK